MSAWTISPMAPGDIDPVMAIERKLFPRPWLRLSFEKEIECESARIFVVKPRQYEKMTALIVAYAGYRLIFEEMHVLKIGVDPLWHRLGIASRLLTFCFNQAESEGAEKAFLEVRASNRPAITLYRKLGFELIGVRPRYYEETNEDALLMIKSLKEETS